MYIVVNHSFYIITVYIHHTLKSPNFNPPKNMALQQNHQWPNFRVEPARPLDPNVPKKRPARHAAAPWTNPVPPTYPALRN